MAIARLAPLTDDRLFSIASAARAGSRPGGRLDVEAMCRRVGDALRQGGVADADAAAARLLASLDAEDVWSARRIARRLRAALDAAAA